MSAITKVAFAGATGNLGPAILEQLLEAGFNVTILTRQGSTHKYPESVTVKTVDYDSVESLTDALRGQDAVVAALGFAALGGAQLRLLEAAVKAGVRRFLPSEFGSDGSNEKARELAVFADKRTVREALAREAAKGTITYTAIYNGPFFDWGIKAGLILDPRKKVVTLYNGGTRPFSTTTLKTIGKAVVAVLRKPEETANRGVYVQDAAPTLKHLRAVAEKVTITAWKAKEVSVEEDVLAPSLAELAKESPDPSKFVLPQIITSIWGEGFGGNFQKLDNELLGLGQFTEADIEAVVDAAVN